MRLPAPTHPLPCLLLCLALLPAVASAQTDEEKRAAMNAAYRQYQELIAQGPQMRAQAEAPAREAYELALDVLGDAHATTAALAMNYGNVLADGDAAARVLEQALEITENLHGDEALELIDPLMALGDSATAHSEFADARGHYERALEIAENQPEPDTFLTAVIAIQLGTTAFSLDRPREAIAHFTLARDNLAAIDNDIARVRLATANFWIGRYHIQQQADAEAIGPLQEALAVFERFPEARQLSVNTLTALVEAHERLGQRAEATPHAQNLGAGTSAPTLIYRPQLSHALWERGEVALLVDVDAEGFVQNVRVPEGTEPEFAAAVREAVTALRYAPRHANGAAAASTDVRLAFQFSRPARR